MAARFVLLKTHLVFALILILATLNRNSSIVLVALYALVTIRNWRNWREWLPVLAYGLLWALVYGLLVLTRHPAYELVNLADIVHENLSSGNVLVYTIPNNAALLPLFVLALAGWRLNPFLKRAGWAALIYIPPLVIAALWWEIRLWLPLIAIMLPMGLLYLEQKQKPR